jgi:hypothetical protein
VGAGYFLYYSIVARVRKKRGRPATGHDPVVPVRLPRKLLNDIEAWAQVYRDDTYEMTRSTAIRCLILLGLEAVQYRVVDPKDKRTFERETLPLLRFFKRPMITKLLLEGTSKPAKRTPPIIQRRPGHERPTKAQVNAAVERAIARSKIGKPWT